MPTIVKIGYRDFLVAKPADAAAVIKALAGAISMESRYRHGRICYYPAKPGGDAEISMRTVRPGDLFNQDPGDTDITEDAAGDGQTVRHHGDRQRPQLTTGQRLLKMP